MARGKLAKIAYFVYWPVALRPDPERALLISYGIGSTAKALTDTLESIANEKKNMLAKAEFPIAGLSFDDRGRIRFEDMPMRQARHDISR